MMTQKQIESYFKLFDHMLNEYNLVLSESQMDEIIRLSGEVVKDFDINCNIPNVKLSFLELKDKILKFKAKSEYKQASIIMLKNIFNALKEKTC